MREILANTMVVFSLQYKVYPINTLHLKLILCYISIMSLKINKYPRYGKRLS